MGLKIISVTGEDSGKMSKSSDHVLNVPSSKTNKIQEMHIIVGHYICGKLKELSSPNTDYESCFSR